MIFSSESSVECENVKKLICSSLVNKSVAYPSEKELRHPPLQTVVKEEILDETEIEKIENQPQSPTDTTHKEAEVVPDPGTCSCSPPRKKQKIDMECILMGDELTDMDINFAQQLLKQQFKHVNGLHSILLQEIDLALTASLLQNRIQIT